MKLSQTLLSSMLAVVVAACGAGSGGQGQSVPAGKALFNSFVYTVNLPGEASGGESTEIVNPILPGCYPDPSICRVDSDYYLINSSFAFYPGVPIWHSTDLRHWERLGYVLNRPSQLTFSDGLRISGGIYASDIKYNPGDSLFYMITTNVDGVGTMYVTTDDPKRGEWSDPVRLPEVGGIDPGFLFDTDGKAYIVNNDAPVGEPLYDGHRAIWIREFDWRNGCVKGEQRVIINGGVDISKRPIWIEGPHLYHINGRYYLMAAEGGTGDDHSEVVFSASSPYGPFKPCAINPILTQRDLPADRPDPVTCAGHADLVQTPEGDWYAVCLAVRPYHDGHDVMGRETFLLPVTWQGGQPMILPAGSVINYRNRALAPVPLWTAEGLSDEAFFIRSPRTAFYTIDESGGLSLAATDMTIDSGKQPAAIGRWITNNVFEAETALSFAPQSADDFAGMILFHDDGSNIRFGKSLDGQGKPCLKLVAYSNGELYSENVIPLSKRDAKRELHLKVNGDEVVNYTFSYSFNPDAGWQQAAVPVPADLLSTQTAGGFTGTMVGIYATSTHKE